MERKREGEKEKKVGKKEYRVEEGGGGRGVRGEKSGTGKGGGVRGEREKDGGSGAWNKGKGERRKDRKGERRE